MHILISPNAFKNSLDAPAAAAAIEKGLQQSRLSFTSEKFPVGDGGDGTAALLLQRLGGQLIGAEVHDPLGRKISTSFGWIEKNRTAIIELADASGLRLLRPDEYNPLRSTTQGTGELILQALDKKAERIILGIGGSATVDGAAGILTELGIRFIDGDSNRVPHLPENLIYLEQIDTSNLDQRILNTELVVLCDVDNHLLGKTGAAAIFGPQKGADEGTVIRLEAGLSKLNEVAARTTGKDMANIQYGGAAGGVAAGLSVFLGAMLVSGIEYFLTITAFDQALEKAAIVITGEGSIDQQTLQGKAPFGVAKSAKKYNIPVIALAGKLPLIISQNLRNYFDILIPINHEPVALELALQNTAENLTRTAREIGELLAVTEK
jgi:glycerate kinase